MSTLLIRHAESAASFDDARRELRGASVLVRDHLIEAIGPAAELPATADEVIDARGHLVMPGLVNTHHHMYQSLTRIGPTTVWARGDRSLGLLGHARDAFASAAVRSMRWRCRAGSG
jgi:cytosine/adenosine deaminase-related metal-dependent hydrolase